MTHTLFMLVIASYALSLTSVWKQKDVTCSHKHVASTGNYMYHYIHYRNLRL